MKLPSRRFLIQLRTMSHFSNALARLTEGKSLIQISQQAQISQQMLSSYRSGNRGIKPGSLAKLIQAFPEEEAFALVAAHLRDECPSQLYPNLEIRFDETPWTEESAANYPADKDLATALEFFAGGARRNPELRQLLLDLYKVLR